MLPIHLVIQSELLRNRDHGVDETLVSSFTAESDWKDDLKTIEHNLEGKCRPMVLASIQVCEYIRRHHPFLARGVIADFDFCTFSKSMMAIPRDMRLNNSFIMMPFGEIANRIDQIERLFGDRVFIKPNDSRKSFTGFSTSIGNLMFECKSLRQISSIRDGEICVIDKAQDFKRTEFRTWLIDGRVATIAPYSHYGPTRTTPGPDVWEAAKSLAGHLEMVDNALVVDFAVLENQELRVVEINAPSTSGVYAGADLSAIMQAFDQILL